MESKILKISRNNRGQGVMEYLIITSLVGIICLVTVQQFGTAIKTRITSMKTQIVKQIKIK